MPPRFRPFERGEYRPSYVGHVDELDPLVGAVRYDIGELNDIGYGDGGDAKDDVWDARVPDEAFRLYLAPRVDVVDTKGVVLADGRLLAGCDPIGRDGGGEDDRHALSSNNGFYDVAGALDVHPHGQAAVRLAPRWEHGGEVDYGVCPLAGLTNVSRVCDVAGECFHTRYFPDWLPVDLGKVEGDDGMPLRCYEFGGLAA